MDRLSCGRLRSKQCRVLCAFSECVESFLLCIVGKMAQDVGMAQMCCGVVPILFGWFLRVPSLHALVFIWKTFLGLVPAAFFIEVVREKRGRQGEDAWSVGMKHGTVLFTKNKEPS